MDNISYCEELLQNIRHALYECKNNTSIHSFTTITKTHILYPGLCENVQLFESTHKPIKIHFDSYMINMKHEYTIEYNVENKQIDVLQYKTPLYPSLWNK